MSEANQQPPQYYPPHPYYQEEDELSLIDLWNIVWKRKWLWLTLGPLVGVIGIFYALSQPEIYRAEATLAPASEEDGSGGLAALAGQFGGLASIAGIDLGNSGGIETAMATLKSRRFLVPFLYTEEYLKVLFPDEWDEQAKAWTISKPFRDETNRPTKQEAYQRFTGGVLDVSEDKKTGIVTLAIELEDPNVAAKWTNELTRRINETLRSEARKETETSLDFLREQLQKTQILEIRQSFYALIESQTQKAMLANAKEDYAFKVIDPAVAPEKRVRPKRTLIVVAAGILGGFLGIFLCFVSHFIEMAKKEEKLKDYA